MATYYVDGAVGNDSNAGTAEGSGNAWATINKAATTAAAGDTVHIKASATYTLTSAQTFTNSGNATSGPIIYRGYTTTPGADDGRPLITSSTNGITLFNISGKSMLKFQHLKFTHTAATRGHAFAVPSAIGFSISITDCEIDGCLDGVAADNSTNWYIANLNVERCKIRTTRHGIYIFGGSYIDHCLLYECGSNGVYVSKGAANPPHQIVVSNSAFRDCSNGIEYSPDNSGGLAVRACALYSNANHGIYKNSNTANSLSVCNSIFYGNGGYGINIASGKVVEGENCTNAYGMNTIGDRNGWSTGIGDVPLTADPFTNAANNDFSLNTTAGGGAALRNAGFPGVSHFGTGYADIGPLRHQDAGGGGTGIGVLVGGGLAR
jgi:hypothetical protein